MPHLIPNHRRGRIANRQRGCAVLQRRHRPRRAAVGRVVEARIARTRPLGVHQSALVRLRNRGHHHLRVHRAPRKARKAFAREGVPLVGRGRNQAPRGAAVGRTQNARAVIGIHRIVRVAGPGQHHAGSARLHRQRSNADRRVARGNNRLQRIGHRREHDIRRRARACIFREPHTAARGAHIQAIPCRVRRVKCHRRNASSHQPVAQRTHCRWTQRLPCRRASTSIICLHAHRGRWSLHLRGTRPYGPAALRHKAPRRRHTRWQCPRLHGNGRAALAVQSRRPRRAQSHHAHGEPHQRNPRASGNIKAKFCD